jgi:hypothetical protein
MERKGSRLHPYRQTPIFRRRSHNGHGSCGHVRRCQLNRARLHFLQGQSFRPCRRLGRGCWCCGRPCSSLQIFPEQSAALNAAYKAALARIHAGNGKAAGIAVGEKTAAEIISWRATDGPDAPNEYRPVTAPGVYVVTTFPVAANWGHVTPWIMERGSQFRPAAPPQLNSQEWVRDYDEIRDWGGKKSTLRTPEQTEIGRFWAMVGPPSGDPIVRELAAAPGRALLQNARLFAMVC